MKIAYKTFLSIVRTDFHLIINCSLDAISSVNLYIQRETAKEKVAILKTDNVNMRRQEIKAIN
jgi:hypothetical protein